MLPKSFVLGVAFVLLAGLLAAQTTPAPQDRSALAAANEVAGTYGFLREGEFVQLTVEDGKLSGFISRFGDSSSDKGQFINQFFDKTSLNGDRLTFTTKVVHGVWYEFEGTANTASGKRPDDEGYRVLKGNLTQHTSDAAGAQKAMQRKVEFKSFPAYVSRP